MGWTPEYISELHEMGFELLFREDKHTITPLMGLGYIYGFFFKMLRLDRRFGHSNPYHRYAFPNSWWYKLSRKAHVAVIHYSFWAHLPTDCPKAIVLHDLISNFAHEDSNRETKELKQANLVIVISKDEEIELNNRGVNRTLWSPPSIPQSTFAPSREIGLVGSDNRFNREGLRWLNSTNPPPNLKLRVYGKLSRHIPSEIFIPMGSYDSPDEPYRDCGVILMTTASGTGVQIKAIEALAAGRAIIARKGAMRGIPIKENSWIEVESPEMMLDWAARMKEDPELRNYWASSASTYYSKYLDSNNIVNDLKNAFMSISRYHKDMPGRMSYEK